MSLKIKIFGWQHLQLDQVSRIKQGFLELGHEIVDNNEDFIYCHDSSQYDNAINYHFQNNKNAINYYFQNNKKNKLLLKVLDLGIHCGNDLNKLKEKLLYADVVLANSITVQLQIKDYLNLESFVVYDAIKDVKFIPEFKKEIDFFALGRLHDVFKRSYLIKKLSLLLEHKNKSFVFCGPEHPGFGFHYGIIDDEMLNKVYNASKICLCVSQYEGLYLPPLEACVAGCVPIICSDMSTCNELNLPEFVCESNVYSINKKVREIESNYKHYQNLALNYGQNIAKKFDKKSVCDRIIQAFELVKNR